MPFLKRVFSACLFLCILLAGPQGCASRIKLAVAGSFVQDVALATARHGDIDLAAQAAPTYLLLLEGLLGDHPNNQTLLIATAQAYMGYGALVESENPDRARSLYRRAKIYGLRALSQKRKIAPLLNAPFSEFSRISEHLKTGDVELVFWTASSWGSWISANIGSMGALAELPKVILLMEWVLQQDESIQFGSPHLFLGVFHAALPPALGGKPDRALFHFNRALEISQDHLLMPRVLMARYYARQIFDRQLYESLLQEVLILPIDTVPELTLQNVAAQRQARQLLKETDDFF